MIRKRKKSYKLYALTVIVLGIAIIVMSVVLLFYVQKIEVTGNEYTDSQEIVELAKEDRYTFNSLYVLWKYRFSDYEKPGSVVSMKASLKNPWTVKIRVGEKEIIGYVYDEGSYVYFDKEGTVVLKETKILEGVPCIEGISAAGTELYATIPNIDEDLFEAILDTTTQLKQFELAPDRIVCGDSGIYLVFQDVCVALGDKVTLEKMAQIPPILSKLQGQTGTLRLEHYEDESNTITFDSGELPEEVQEK